MRLGGKYRARFLDQSRVFDVGDRTAKVRITAEVSRWDNDERNLIYREVSPGRVEEFYAEVLSVSVFDEDTLLGEYSGSDIPYAEVKYWAAKAEVWLKRRLEKDPDFFNWNLEDEGDLRYETF